MPILQVLLISILGAFMATEYLNLLPADARRSLNKVMINAMQCNALCIHTYMIYIYTCGKLVIVVTIYIYHIQKKLTLLDLSFD
jgi:hypothetical protein